MSGQSRVPRLAADGPDRWRIEPEGSMRVPGVVFASDALLPHIEEDQALQQVVNVACLPGIVEASYAMPDIHSGYGFPIGGVAATDVEDGGVVSPGGVGFDISCGVRLLAAPLTRHDLADRLDQLMDALERRLPHGLGPGGVWSAPDEAELEKVLTDGSKFVVERGFGDAHDLQRCEDRGVLDGAVPEHVSDEAKHRGIGQLGSIGSGNHFAEVQWVDHVYDSDASEAFGLEEGQVCVMIHCGSRGLGHQVCTDHVRTMEKAMSRYGVEVPDRQLAGVPVRSPEGEAYFGAMAAAANYGRANRQLLAHATRQAFAEVVGEDDVRLVYDVSHNLAKLERHPVAGGADRLLCVHRKGATRAFGPGHPDLPDDLADAGQPVLVPGSMGTASYVLTGVTEPIAFASACHGAGRTMSRTQARKQIHGRDLRAQLEDDDIRVRAGSWKGLAEEAPFSYKDVDEVVETCERAGLAHRVARLRPLGVVKG